MSAPLVMARVTAQLMRVSAYQGEDPEVLLEFVILAILQVLFFLLLGYLEPEFLRLNFCQTTG